jgi:hypothetical protein
MRNYKILALALCLSCVLFATCSALADSTYTLSNSGVSGPSVNVDVSLNSADNVATITFTTNTPCTNCLGMIDQGAFDLNVNGTFSVASTSGFAAYNGNFCSSGTLVGNGCVSGKSSNNIDGFGNFNLEIDQFDGSGSAVNTLTVVLDGSWTSAANVLFGNTGGSDAATHFSINGGACTFYMANGSTNSPADCATSVAEPSSLFGLLGAGLIGVPFIRRKLIV